MLPYPSSSPIAALTLAARTCACDPGQRQLTPRFTCRGGVPLSREHS